MRCLLLLLVPVLGCGEKMAADAGNAETGDANCAVPLVFEDPRLDDAVRDAVGIEIGDICPSHVVGLTRLPNVRIDDLSGAEGLVDLRVLHHPFGNISDLTPLRGLSKLHTIHLYSNDIHDLAPLDGLARLRTLELSLNSIRDLTPLAGLTELSDLGLNNNDITDLTPLTGLASLERLFVENNNYNCDEQAANIEALEASASTFCHDCFRSGDECN